MRIIRFRGKRVSDGEWVYGNLLAGTNERNIDVAFIAPTLPFVAEANDLWGAKMYRVDPKSVGQFTGLCDKHGREIYEGDIVTFYELKTYCINPDCEPHLLGYSERLHKKTKVVRFEDGMFGVDGEYLPIEVLAGLGEWGSDEEFMTELRNDPYFDANGYDLGSVAGVEVVGNVFDNPELLKGGEE